MNPPLHAQSALNTHVPLIKKITKTASLTLLGISSLLLANCASTPETRIAKNPQIYQSLDQKQQNLVSKGKIDLGLPRDGVFLAMGNPDNRITGNHKGKAYERWDYNKLIPVYTNHIGGYYGTGYYGRHRHYAGYYAPSVTYVPTRGSSIYFHQNKVTGWERSE